MHISIFWNYNISFGTLYLQDVQDVLRALDYVISKGLVDPKKVAVTGGSHGGFLSTHLIGQVLIQTICANFSLNNCQALIIMLVQRWKLYEYFIKFQDKPKKQNKCSDVLYAFIACIRVGGIWICHCFKLLMQCARKYEICMWH